jgi:hypothetical protein
MEARIEKLVNAFENNGWTLMGSADVSGDWWFQDIIHLTSKWHPVGINLYLTLLTDPQFLRKKIVLDIGISSLIPDSQYFHYIEHVSLNDIKKTNLDSLVNRINRVVLK